MAKDKEFTYEITAHLVKLSEPKGGWVKEVNKVRWGSSAPVVDIRQWHYPEGEEEPDRMSKGITLNRAELENLAKYLKDYDFDQIDLPF